MSWPLAEELEKAGYDGEPTIVGMLNFLSKCGRKISLKGYDDGRWKAALFVSKRKFIPVEAEAADTALATLILVILNGAKPKASN